jgi:Skp family chaperone for outer membrane proteins
MKRSMLIVVVAVFCAAFVLSGVCGAQEGKIAFVDFQKFAEKSQKAQEQQKSFMNKVTVKKQALETKKKEYDELREQLEKQGPMLKEDTRNAKIKELAMKEMELKLAEKEAENALQNEQRDAQEIFRRDISKVIAAVRAEKKLMMVFNSAALLSVDDSLDITDEVARRYDAEAGAAKPAPAAPKKPAAAPAPKKPAAPAK